MQQKRLINMLSNWPQYITIENNTRFQSLYFSENYRLVLKCLSFYLNSTYNFLWYYTILYYNILMFNRQFSFWNYLPQK